MRQNYLAGDIKKNLQVAEILAGAVKNGKFWRETSAAGKFWREIESVHLS